MCPPEVLSIPAPIAISFALLTFLTISQQMVEELDGENFNLAERLKIRH